jgi:indole-3-acetate monooxygenase
MNSRTIPPEAVSSISLMESAHQIGSILSQHIEEEENSRRISRPVFDALLESGFFRLFLPRSLGGYEVDPVTAAKLVEKIAGYNTAAGWTLMVTNTATWWCNRLSDKGIEEIYKSGPDTFIAGAFHPPMSATRVNGGYVINGRSPLASNVHEAKWIFVTAFVMEKGEMKITNGIPELIGVFMSAEACQIIDTWHTIGMRATDSNDVQAKDVFVPDHLSYPLVPEFEPNIYYTGPLYQFPAIGASIASLIVPVALAVARNAIEELKALAVKKVPFASAVSIRERGSVQRKLGMAEALVQSSRAYLHYEITELWKKILSGRKLTLEERASLLLSVTHTNQSCVQAVDMMYSAAGTSGIYLRNRLAHYFTDAQVIRQHGFSNESRYETAAQIYFGLQPDLPVIAF